VSKESDEKIERQISPNVKTKSNLEKNYEEEKRLLLGYKVEK
jgi:hypothetical protein